MKHPKSCSAALLALGAALPFSAVAEPAAPAKPAPWTNDFTGRLEALAVLQTLNAELLSHDSATLTLDRWCDGHHLAQPAKIVAQRDKATVKPASPETRKALGATDQEPIQYRRVKLMCGAHVLSEADNWYVPARLTPEMNKQLETTDIAFGRAVQALHFQRHTVSAKLLWSPLPDGWDVAGDAPPAAPGTGPGASKALAVPHEVLQHQAVLVLPNGTPFSQVVETYTEEVLAFPQPRAGR